uniref:Uncharacterized protein n=1 Tax=Oryza punctata TaxID=4537 RepID=A0A0E0M9M3_ORYPU
MHTFLSMDLPKNKPIFPVVSTRQRHDVVYLVLAVAERHGHVDGNKRDRTTKRVKYLISVDMRLKKVLFCSSYNSPGRLWPNLIDSDFSAYLHDSKDDQVCSSDISYSSEHLAYYK